jgi:adenylate cyclase
MTLSPRARRQRRIFYVISVASAVVSAGFGYFNRASDDTPWHAMSEGIAASITIATPILLYEIYGARIGAFKRLSRLPLLLYFMIKVLFYSVVIVGGLFLMRFLFTPDLAHLGRVDVLFRRSLLFAIGMSVFANLAIQIGTLLGFGTLRNLMTGRYVQPRAEDRIFLLVDMRNSTGIAERLGPVRFHELLNDFFRDIADAALECGGEIHKYVGDEAILTWKGDDALAGSDCLECPFMAASIIEKNRHEYLAKYGEVPTFRAAVHCGEIVAGEIGDVRREIAYVGDTLNATAKLLEAAKSLGHGILASSNLLERTRLPAGVSAEKLPPLILRGRAAPLGAAALARA